MKKRNIFILLLFCVLLLFVFAGLIVYAIQLQEKKDTKSITEQYSENTVSPTVTSKPKITVAAIQDKTNVNSPTPQPTLTSAPTSAANASKKQVVLGFAGDVNMDENYFPANKYDLAGAGISGIISDGLVKEMNEADVMMLNNEFCYSTRGTKAANKSFTFRANPERVNILKKMGVDVVSLANNHTLDYGPDALADTFKTLEAAGIEYAGAGKNMDRAKAPVYFTVGGRKIAFLAASRVIFDVSWYAGDKKAGMAGTYDPSLMIQSIKEARANSDYVVIFVHWGKERHSSIESNQRTLAQKYIDAGADAVIGCHPHVMQGFEYYKGKPIAYSLGNFIFSNSTDRTGLLKLYLDTNGSVRMQILPAKYSDTCTYLLTNTADKKDYIHYMESISYHVTIDQDGFVTSAK